MKLIASKITGKGIGLTTFVNDSTEVIAAGSEINLQFSIPSDPKKNVNKPTSSVGELTQLGKNNYQLVPNSAIEPDQEFSVAFTVAITVKPETTVDVDFEVVKVHPNEVLPEVLQEEEMWWYSGK